MAKIIFLDIDGTIVDYDNLIPISAKKAIQLARSKGHKIYLNSWRSKAELPNELFEIDFDGIIGGNGNYVENEAEVLLHQALAPEAERMIAEWLLNNDLPFYLESNEGLFASPGFENKAQDALKKYIQGKNPIKDVSKAHAIDVLLSYLKASPKQTVAFGDAKIDIPMFEYCATSVAMENAGQETKTAADLVTTDVNDDGLWNGFKMIGVI